MDDMKPGETRIEITQEHLYSTIGKLNVQMQFMGQIIKKLDDENVTLKARIKEIESK